MIKVANKVLSICGGFFAYVRGWHFPSIPMTSCPRMKTGFPMTQ